jgi:phosphoserine aminotransferase
VGDTRPIVADFIVTGTWSLKAYQEASAISKAHPALATSIVAQTKPFNDLPTNYEWSNNKNRVAYMHYCDNETIHGLEFPTSVSHGDVTVVCDMSSNIFSRPVDVSEFGVIYAGAQKNAGTAGVTLVIVRKDLLVTSHCPDTFPIPLMMNYSITAKTKSVYNTPPIFASYVLYLMCQWMLDQGGVMALQGLAVDKASLVYDCIQSSGGFYACIVHPRARSRMNICFRVCKNTIPSPELEKDMVQAAEQHHLMQIAGHRSVGGIRVSVYNAVTVEAVQRLVQFMNTFKQQHTQ